MTFDLEAAKRLAQRLAGDVMNQLERDGCANRENLAEQLLAGLVLEAAIYSPKLDENQAGGLQGLISKPAPSVKGYIDIREKGGRLVNTGVHVECLCDDCRRRRSISLCGCEMCLHHTEAAALQADAEKAGRCTPGQARAIIDSKPAWNSIWRNYAPQQSRKVPMYQGVDFASGADIETTKDNAGEIITLSRDGLAIWYRGDIKRIWSVGEIDRLFFCLQTIRKGNAACCVPLDNLDLVLQRDGELITSLEAAQRGSP